MNGPKYLGRLLLALICVQLTGVGGCVPGALCVPGTGSECSEGSFCKIPDGECDNPLAVGICTPVPEACTLEYNPVCGCDGQTYGNPCAANAAGVSVSHPGECGQICGGIQGLACDDGEYCRYEPDALCGAADQTGVCEVMPEVCTEEFAPVCGCDDQTYDNACFAARAGVSVVHDGACDDEIEVRICGGIQGLACDEGEYCRYEPDALCGAADQTGVCEVMPEVCTEEFAPVCGCDDQTYPNACFAAMAGVSVQDENECP